MSNKYQVIFSVLTRLVAVGFVVLTAFSIPECWKLLNEDFTVVGDTLYVPLSYCSSNEPTLVVTNDGTTIYLTTPTTTTTTPETVITSPSANNATTTTASPTHSNDGTTTVDEGSTAEETTVEDSNAFGEGMDIELESTSPIEESSTTTAIETSTESTTEEISTTPDNSRRLQNFLSESNNNNEEPINGVFCDSERDLLFVYTTTFSLVIAALALVIFLFIDFLSRCKKNCCGGANGCCCKCIKPSLTLGMGFFVTFILLQAGFSMLSLVQEGKWWQETYQDFLDQRIAASDAVEVAQTHGNLLLLSIAAYVAFAASVFMLLDGIVLLCTEGGTSSTLGGASSESSYPDLVSKGSGESTIPIPHQMTDRSDSPITDSTRSPINAADTNIPVPELSDIGASPVSTTTPEIQTTTNSHLPPWAQP